MVNDPYGLVEMAHPLGHSADALTHPRVSSTHQPSRALPLHFTKKTVELDDEIFLVYRWPFCSSFSCGDFFDSAVIHVENLDGKRFTSDFFLLQQSQS